ncbi:hypothetical protein P167DRAFT_187508 [Morchella conica CCBAS932]|uniref:Uncharacterized protein n=1 Tax=Morchella conica CCBAS932 TaxID=1392247 RepID=A0A3N4L1C5_9PEZI|nr:hypothetical protein P167DRAFT_187508 [Morchella conica CCBAS932]
MCTSAGAWALCGAEDINCTVYDGLMSESIHAYIIYTHVSFCLVINTINFCFPPPPSAAA